MQSNAPSSSSTRYLTVYDVARRYGVSPSLIYDAMHYGRLPHLRLGSRTVRIPEAALAQWEQAQLAASMTR